MIWRALTCLTKTNEQAKYCAPNPVRRSQTLLGQYLEIRTVASDEVHAMAIAARVLLSSNPTYSSMYVTRLTDFEKTQQSIIVGCQCMFQELTVSPLLFSCSNSYKNDGLPRLKHQFFNTIQMELTERSRKFFEIDRTGLD